MLDPGTLPPPGKFGDVVRGGVDVGRRRGHGQARAEPRERPARVAQVEQLRGLLVVVCLQHGAFHVQEAARSHKLHAVEHFGAVAERRGQHAALAHGRNQGRKLHPYTFDGAFPS